MQLQHTELIVKTTTTMMMMMMMITCQQNLQLLKKRTICSSLTGWNLNQTVSESISY